MPKGGAPPSEGGHASGLPAQIPQPRPHGSVREAGRFSAIPLPSDFDPRTLLTGPDAAAVSAYYERPHRDLVLVGIGEAARIEVPAGHGPELIRDPALRLLQPDGAPDGGRNRGPNGGPLRPRLLGGFAFDPSAPPGGPWSGFDCGWLTLPRLLFVREDGVSGGVVAPGSDPAEVDELLARSARASLAAEDAQRPSRAPLRVLWDINRPALLAAVADIAGDVRAGLYEKAVLASVRELEASTPIDPGAALAQLRADYPHCHLFSFRRGDAIFLGASPELLAGLHDGVISSLGLAGSARRGQTPEEDEALGEQLLQSAKDRIEHEIVVRALREGISELADDLHAPNQPDLQRLHNIQHLATEVSARARPGLEILDLVQRLHPTPAVCGWPTEAAREVIAQHERFDRGWYAGPIGWIDGAGEGEFAVALRSALVRGRRAWLFAGAGIMGDSDPPAELAEIELKFQPLTSALGGGRM